MNEFIKKLIERLEEELKLADETKEKCARENPLMFDNAKGYATGIANAKYFVNQLAEEHKDDIQTIDVSELLGEQGNDGWIACSERLPEERFFDDGYVEPSYKVLVFTKYGDYKTSRYWGNRRNKRDYYDWLDIDYRKDEVIAWKPIAPYQPKGE